MTQNITPSTKETNIDGMLIGFILFLLIFTGVSLYKYNKTAVDTKVKRVLNRDAHVAILSTYGPSVSGSPFYEAYVDKAMKFILDPTNKVNELIIVGGYTVDQNTSQSQAVLNYIKDKYAAFNTSGIPVTLDECGITTWQNIENAKELMDREGIGYKKITIFAEESRERKVAFFANGVFQGNTSIGMSRSKIIREIDPLVSASKNEQLLAYRSTNINTDWQRFTSLVNKDIQIVTVTSGLPQQFVDEEHIKLFEEIKEYSDPFIYGRQKVKERLDSWSQTAGFNTVENLVTKGCVEYKEFLKK